jgi:hypothetical protein
LSYIEGKLFKIITFKLSIHGGCQYKVGLWKIYIIPT